MSNPVLPTVFLCDHSAINPALIVEWYFNHVHKVIARLEDYRTNEKELMLIPLGEINDSHYEVFYNIWLDFYQMRRPQIGPNGHVLPYMSEDQKKEFELLKITVHAMEKEINGLFIQLTGRIKVFLSPQARVKDKTST